MQQIWPVDRIAPLQLQLPKRPQGERQVEAREKDREGKIEREGENERGGDSYGIIEQDLRYFVALVATVQTLPCSLSFSLPLIPSPLSLFLSFCALQFPQIKEQSQSFSISVLSLTLTTFQSLNTAITSRILSDRPAYHTRGMQCRIFAACLAAAKESALKGAAREEERGREETEDAIQLSKHEEVMRV